MNEGDTIIVHVENQLSMGQSIRTSPPPSAQGLRWEDYEADSPDQIGMVCCRTELGSWMVFPALHRSADFFLEKLQVESIELTSSVRYRQVVPLHIGSRSMANMALTGTFHAKKSTGPQRSMAADP